MGRPIKARIRAALKILRDEDAIDLGGSYRGGSPARPEEDVRESMSAFAAFPWVFAAVQARAAALAGLPLQVLEGDGRNAKPLEDHPFLELMSQPSTHVSGEAFRRQQVVDLTLTGNAFGVVAGGRDPAAVVRLHPELVTIVPNQHTGITAYRYSSAGLRVDYDPSIILHTRWSSWATGPASQFGQGIIRALRNELSADFSAQQLTARRAKMGRPDVLLRPSEDGDVWDKDTRAEILGAYQRAVNSDSGGALVLGGGAVVDALSLSPREMEFGTLRDMVRQAILAVTGVPPVVMGLETANYATAREQKRTFWETLQSDARILDSQLTRLARMFGTPRVRVVHDFSRVDALQASRTEAQARAMNWWTMGIPLPEALAAEGFDDIRAPSEAVRPASPSSAGNGARDDEASRSGRGHLISLDRFLVGEPAPSLKALFDGEPEPEIDPDVTAWRSFLSDVHEPSERRMTRTMSTFLKAQGRRVAERTGDALQGWDPKGQTSWTTKQTEAQLEGLLSIIFPEGMEGELLTEAMLKDYEDAIRHGLEVAAASMANAGAGFDPDRLDPDVQDKLGQAIVERAKFQAGRMQQEVDATTKKKINEVLNESMREGLTVSQIQGRLLDLKIFAPIRALAVARTETTRASAAGSLRAYEEAEALGVVVKKRWLTAQDELVREAHRELGRQPPIPVGDPFTATDRHGARQEAQAPGGFGAAGLVVNCRCAIIPVIED